MPSTIAHALLPIGCSLVLKYHVPSLRSVHWFRLVLLAAFLGNAPDLDLIPASLFPSHWDDIHREWGHNLFSVCGLGWLGALAIRSYVYPGVSRRLAFVMSLALVLSHLFLDSMHDLNEYGVLRGVPLFWPLTDQEYRLPFKIFKSFALDPSHHQFVAHVLAVGFWTRALLYEIVAGVCLIGIWTLGVITTKRWWLKQESPVTEKSLPYRQAS